MADSKISALTSVSSIDGTQEYAVNDSGTTKKATATQQTQYSETRMQQGVLCSHASDQAVTTSTWTALSFDTEEWKVGDSDTHSTVTNNERLTAQIDGEYIVTGVIGGEAIASSFIVQARLRLNGSGAELWRDIKNSLNDATFPTTVECSALVQLSATDYLTLEMWHNRGSDLDALSSFTSFGMYLVGR
jgi:hypothetical protein